jgi:hypothetical protein
MISRTTQSMPGSDISEKRRRNEAELGSVIKALKTAETR